MISGICVFQVELLHISLHISLHIILHIRVLHVFIYFYNIYDIYMYNMYDTCICITYK